MVNLRGTNRRENSFFCLLRLEWLFGQIRFSLCDQHSLQLKMKCELDFSGALTKFTVCPLYALDLLLAACVAHSRSAHQNRHTLFVRSHIFELLTGYSQRHLYSFRCIGGAHENSNTKAIQLVFLFFIGRMCGCCSQDPERNMETWFYEIIIRSPFIWTMPTTCDCTRLTMSLIRIG